MLILKVYKKRDPIPSSLPIVPLSLVGAGHVPVSLTFRQQFCVSSFLYSPTLCRLPTSPSTLHPTHPICPTSQHPGSVFSHGVLIVSEIRTSSMSDRLQPRLCQTFSRPDSVRHSSIFLLLAHGVLVSAGCSECGEAWIMGPASHKSLRVLRTPARH